MERINDILINYFPCPLSWYCGYFCCIFTLGLSLLCPLICINEAEEGIREFIDRVNAKKLKDKKMRLVLRKRCGTSWLEWHLPAEIRGTAVDQSDDDIESLNNKQTSGTALLQ